MASEPLLRYGRILLVMAGIAMLFFMPTREFLKVTFMIGMPLVFIMGFMFRQTPYSFTWVLCALFLLAGIGAYGYFLYHLPERIQVRQIVSTGGALVAEGKYDAAIREYQRLEKLGQKVKMTKKIAEAREEQSAYQQLERARELIRSGKKEEARRIIENLPAATRAAVEARRLQK